jgi:ribosomal protein S18 acetylase RimI-like enzyme
MTADVGALKTLWQAVFGDPESWLNRFFENCFSENRYHALWEENRAISALYWFDCVLNDQKIAYIYAVATDEKHRGRGLATRLMGETHGILRENGYAGAILVPSEEKLFGFYEKLGYRTATAVGEFTADAAGAPVPLQKIDAESYVNLRKQYLPPNGVVQGREVLALLDLYRGSDFLLAANVHNNTLYTQELLGNAEVAPQILQALNLPHGNFRTPGEDRPFAMFLPLQENCPMPAYFGIALD